MKLVLYSIILSVLLLGVASATPSCEAAADNTDALTENSQCWVIKPVEPMVGDSITINCTKYINENNHKEYKPIKGLQLHISVYDADLEQGGQELYVATGSEGTYTFIPTEQGDYLIQHKWGYSKVTVYENPDLEVVEDDSPTGLAIAADEPDEVVVEPMEEEPEKGILDVMTENGSLEGAEEKMSGLLLMLVGFLIA